MPFLQLPLSQLPSDFFPLTCRTCVDYTNVLADLTVGYMGGRGQQWLLVRNERGEPTRAFEHICWDGCMFPNIVMTDPRTWQDILAVMIAVRAAHGWD